MIRAALLSLLLTGAAGAANLSVQPLEAHSRYIEIPAEGGPVWEFEREGESIEVMRDSHVPDVYRIKILQQEKEGERRELSCQLLLSPATGPLVIGGIQDSERGRTVYLISVAPGGEAR